MINFLRIAVVLAILYLMAPTVLILMQAMCYLVGSFLFIVFCFALIGEKNNVDQTSKESFQRTHKRKN